MFLTGVKIMEKPTKISKGVKCYLCGKSKLKTIKNKLRYDIPRKVLRCSNCGIVYLEPKRKNLKEFYSKEYRKLYTPVMGESLDSQETFNIYFPYQQSRINELKPILNRKMKALDIGCSTGHFLYALKDYINECIGIEFNKENARFVNEKLRIKTYTEPIEKTDILLNSLDLITVFQVLEHIEDPINFLTVIRKYLKPEGYLCIEVPNIQDALISVFNLSSYADFYFKEPHLFYYSPKTLSMVLEKAGFRGKIKTIQRYNFINQINWILTGRFQRSAELGMAKPKLVISDLADKKIKDEFNKWIEKIDGEYKQLLRKYNLGETILFIGKKYD